MLLMVTLLFQAILKPTPLMVEGLNVLTVCPLPVQPPAKVRVKFLNPGSNASTALFKTIWPPEVSAPCIIQMVELVTVGTHVPCCTYHVKSWRLVLYNAGEHPPTPAMGEPTVDGHQIGSPLVTISCAACEP